MGVLQNPGLIYIRRAVHAFLRRLKQQLDRALQLTFPLFEHFGRAQKAGRVEIMAAGMHRTVAGSKGQPRFLRHGQRLSLIHI